PVTVTDPNALTGSSYTLSFGTNAAGDLTYTLAKDGTPATTQVFDPSKPISFDGLSVSITGTPAKGDQFTVQPSGFQSLFDTVDRFATALETAQDGASGRAAYQNIGNQTLQNLDQALGHILSVRAQIGGRLSALDNGRDANGAAVLNLQTTKSGIDDLDYASAVTALYQHLTALQAAEQSYAKIQGLSLFNYL
ncbi:MAG TPA: flagellin, partial [Nitrococcus sp.]|nr:flagellin [Nitrococcus sp.]